MSALYDLFENPPAKEGEEQPVLHARIVSKGTVGKNEFLDRVHKFTGISRSLLVGAMEAFYNETRDLLADGWNVEMGNFGYFSTSLQCPPIGDKKEIRSPSIRMKNVNFRASKQCKKDVRNSMRLKRNESSTNSKPNSLSSEICFKRLEEYFKTHLFISRTDYCLLNGRTKKVAVNELNSFIEEGRLRKEGLGKLTIYIKVKDTE